MARQNLVTNPSFRQKYNAVNESGIITAQNLPVGWAATNGATVEVVDGTTALPAFYGGEYLKVTKAAQASSGVETSTRIPVQAGLSYAASVYVKVPANLDESESAALTLKVRWINAAQQYMSEDLSLSSIKTIEPGPEWGRLSVVGLAPVGAVFAEIYIYQLAIGTVNKSFYLDAALLEQSAYVGGYLDNFTQGEENTLVDAALTRKQLPTIGGMELNADITIGDLTLNTIDEDGIIWVCTDIDGWWGHPDPEIPDIPRGIEDGSYDVTGRYTARQLTLSGVFLPQNSDQIGAARDRLIAATNLVRQGAWLRTNEEPTRASFVRLSGRPQIRTVNARGRTEFSIGLRAGDPIKYLWNDADPENLGLTRVTVPGTENIATITNVGTAEVTGIFEITGPAGAGTSIENSLTGETITLVESLRGAGAVGNITKTELLNNVATLTTVEDHQLIVGDIITVSGVGAPYDATEVLVTSAFRTNPYTFSYVVQSQDPLPDLPLSSAFGSVALSRSDVLTINTYDRSVAFNGDITGNRSKIDTLVDWIRFAPGDNEIIFSDSIDLFSVVNKKYDPVAGVSTLTTLSSHFLSPGEEVNVSLPATTELSAKQIVDGVVSLTTSSPHGYSVGDYVDIQTVEVADIVNKELTGNTATLTTAVDGGFAVGDEIVVEMSTVKNIVAKSATGNVITLTTPAEHRYSVGDSVTITLPTTSNVVGKALNSNLATITTDATHNFSVGDVVNVNMPTAATIIGRTISGSSILLASSSAHNFTVGDRINVAFPTSTNIVGTRTYSGGPSYLCTVTTDSPHGFCIGDAITVNIGITGISTVSSRQATTDNCTLTTSAAHNYTVGEEITVSGVSARYNGTFIITDIPATNKVTYAFAGTTEALTSSTGSITNNTIATGYNGTKIVEDIPSTTSLSYLYYGPEDASSSTLLGASPVITNNTSILLNGLVTITSVPNATQFTYTRVV